MISEWPTFVFKELLGTFFALIVMNRHPKKSRNSRKSWKLFLRKTDFLVYMVCTLRCRNNWGGGVISIKMLKVSQNLTKGVGVGESSNLAQSRTPSMKKKPVNRKKQQQQHGNTLTLEYKLCVRNTPSPLRFFMNSTKKRKPNACAALLVNKI